MSIMDTKFADAVEKAAAYISIGQTDIHLYHDNDERPWEFVTDVVEGNSWRLNGPSGARLTAPHPCGLTFSWTVDFENQDANGKGTHLFDRDRLREVMRKLPVPAKRQFGALLKSKVLPHVLERTAEVKKALSFQEDSKDCLLGLITFAESTE